MAIYIVHHIDGVTDTPVIDGAFDERHFSDFMFDLFQSITGKQPFTAKDAECYLTEVEGYRVTKVTLNNAMKG